MNIQITQRYKTVVNEIGSLNWDGLDRKEMMAACMAYYYFSKQFVDAVHIACKVYPDDEQLIALRAGECDTDNLSPYPGVAAKGERMDHDEFMRRTCAMMDLDEAVLSRVHALGRDYLDKVSDADETTRIMSFSTYEDGGLEIVFEGMLRAVDWDTPALGAFKHFLVEHIKLDSGEHGALCRHLVADDRVLPLWEAFRDLLVGAAPRLNA